MTDAPLCGDLGKLAVRQAAFNGPYAQRLAAARALLSAGDIDGAERTAQTLCQAMPAHAGAFLLHARCASKREDGQTALQRWLECRARFAARPEVWRVGLGYALLNEQQFAAAEEQFVAAVADDPTRLVAHAGRALAVSRVAPERAEVLWQDVERRAIGGMRPAWQVARARAFAASGAHERALGMVRAMSSATSMPRDVFALLVRLLIDGDHKGEADAELEDGLLRAGGGASDIDRLRVQLWRNDITAARASFGAAVQDASDAQTLAQLLEFIPQLFETYARGEFWRVLRGRAAALSPSAAAVVVQLRLDLSLRDHDGFLARLDAAPVCPAPWAARFEGIAAALRAPAFPDFSAVKIFGIGLAKTGTSSLGLALERLGYLHAHFTNPFSGEILSDHDFPLFDAVTDVPAAQRFEMLYAMFPNARFILTERPPASWIASFRRHFEHWQQTADLALLRQRQTRRNGTRLGLDLALLHGGLYTSHADPGAAYDAHIGRVEHFFADKPAGKLLRHNVFTGDGWPELCRFLGQDIPAEHYPRINISAARRQGGVGET